ncbi:outer membrane efflux protein [Nitritalea halalkaliphila LW7]|uniref:Outer membrane efflux protein n=1 Tax=Nitritalea halalkaliphila LW7 TaxID=1189621 RepID=I5C3M3_9BACT|nr:TolC family protein [Nitritalea halalkaliphila]EIM76425.1 outer membrane efflux protein [Nitritalea halalkaliphila LW7]
MKKYIYGLVALCFFMGQVEAQQMRVDRLDLRTCIEVALENNLNLKRTEVSLAQEEINLLQTQGQRLPSLSAGASTGFRWGRSINPVTNLFETDRIGNVNLTANSGMPVFQGGQIHYSAQQAKTNIRVGQYNVEATRNNISLNVINLFVNILFAQEQRNIAENQLSITEEQLGVTRKLVEAGSLPLASQLDLEAQLATNELDVINTRNNLRIARLQLAQAMQIPFSEDFNIFAPKLEAENFTLTQNSVEEIFYIAMETLPEMRAAELGIESAEYGIKIARGAFLPSLSLGVNIFTNYVDRIFLGERDPFGTQLENNLSQSANVNLSIPIFSNFRNKAGLQRARLQKRLSEIQEVETRNQILQDIESAYTNAFAARQSYNASVRRVASLEEAFRIAQQRFDSGAINSADYQIAQNNLFNAQADLSNAKFDFIFKVKVLDFYLGNPLEF